MQGKMTECTVLIYIVNKNRSWFLFKIEVTVSYGEMICQRRPSLIRGLRNLRNRFIHSMGKAYQMFFTT